MLTLVAPAALSAGVGWVLARDRSATSATILIGMLGACFSFAVWDVTGTRAIDAYLHSPDSAASKRQIRKGSNLTFSELTLATAAVEEETRPLARCSCANRSATLLRMEWHRRLSIPALAVSFVILAAAVSRVGKRLLVVAILWPSYGATIWYSQASAPYALRGEISVPLSVWGGHLLPLTLAILLVALTARRDQGEQMEAS